MIAAAGKACKACGEWKPVDGFNKCRNADGRMNVCKPCHYAQGHARRQQKRRREGADHIPPTKQCAKCGAVKAACDFAVYRAANDGLGRYCRECDSAVSRARRYGIPEDRVRLMAARKTCECCGGEFKASRQQHFDHRHADGAVRGVLCQSCNSIVGVSGERPAVLLAVARYLGRTADVDYRFQPYPETNSQKSDISLVEAPSPEVNSECQTKSNPRLTQ